MDIILSKRIVYPAKLVARGAVLLRIANLVTPNILCLMVGASARFRIAKAALNKINAPNASNPRSCSKVNALLVARKDIFRVKPAAHNVSLSALCATQLDAQSASRVTCSASRGAQ